MVFGAIILIHIFSVLWSRNFRPVSHTAFFPQPLSRLVTFLFSLLLTTRFGGDDGGGVVAAVLTSSRR